MAQECTLTTTEMHYDDQLREAIQLDVPIPSDDLKDGFNDFFKKELNTDLKGYGFLTRKDEVYTELGVVPGISEKPIKLIGTFKENVDQSTLYLLGQWENNSFTNEKNDSMAFSAIFQLANRFLQYYVPQYYSELLEDANGLYEEVDRDVSKKLSDIERNQDQLTKLRQEILDLENEIVEEKLELVNLESERHKRSEQVFEQKRKLETVLQSLKRIQT
jgi:hypothetical protein